MLRETLQHVQPFAVGGMFLLLFLAEHIFPQRRDLIDNKHDAVNIGIGAFNAVIIFGAGYLMQQWLQLLEDHHFGLLNWIAVPLILRYAIEFLIQDMLIYWWHRFNHRFAFLWQFHRFHHVDKKLNSTSGVRFHVVELLLSYVVRLPVFALLGVSVTGVLLYGIVFAGIVLFHHSSIRFPLRIDFVLRRIVVTPHMHRIHHSVIREETDSNFSSVLSIWDKLFGSYRKIPLKEIEFGVD